MANVVASPSATSFFFQATLHTPKPQSITTLEAIVHHLPLIFLCLIEFLTTGLTEVCQYFLGHCTLSFHRYSIGKLEHNIMLQAGKFILRQELTIQMHSNSVESWFLMGGVLYLDCFMLQVSHFHKFILVLSTLD